MSIEINDLPLLQDLTPEQLKRLFGSGMFRPRLELLEDRLVPAGSIGVANGVITITGDAFQDLAQVRVVNNQVRIDLWSANSSAITDINTRTLGGTPTASIDYDTVTRDLGGINKIVFHGNAGNDFFFNYGSSYTEAFGEAGNDWLVSGKGQDVLDGGTGDDTFVFLGDRTGQDTIAERAGEGSDTLNFSAFERGVKVNLDLPQQYVNATGTSTSAMILILTPPGGSAGSVSPIENIIGTNFDDVLTGNNSANTLTGLAGKDTFEGKGGVDYLHGGTGDDTYVFGANLDLNADHLLENVGEGTDTLDFTNYGRGVNVDLSLNHDLAFSNPRVNLPDGANRTGRPNVGTNVDLTLDLPASVRLNQPGDPVSVLFLAGDVENVLGSDFNDILAGNALDNKLMGQGNSDTLIGRGGSDILEGGRGNDILEGGAGNDTLTGGQGNDTYRFVGIGLGTDRVNEDANLDTDTLDFSAFGRSVMDLNDAEGFFTMGRTVQQNVQNELFLTLSSVSGIENLIGSKANDNSIRGNSRDNVITGGDADDWLSGGDGNDTLMGGAGRDVLQGEDGADILDGGADDDELYGFSKEGYAGFDDADDIFLDHANDGFDYYSDGWLFWWE